MFVCICRAVTDKQIAEAVDEGADHITQLEESCGVGTGCGSCREVAQQLIDERLAESRSYAV